MANDRSESCTDHWQETMVSLSVEQIISPTVAAYRSKMYFRAKTDKKYEFHAFVYQDTKSLVLNGILNLLF